MVGGGIGRLCHRAGESPACVTDYTVATVFIIPFDQPRLALLFYLQCLFCILEFAADRIQSDEGGARQEFPRR